MSKPIAITDEKLGKIVELLKVGVPLYLSARQVGVSDYAVYHACKRGGHEDWRNSPGWVDPEHAQPEYRKIADAIMAAEAESHAVIISKTYAAACRNGRLGIEWLRNRLPNTFSPKQDNTHTLQVDMQPVFAQMNDLLTLQQSGMLSAFPLTTVEELGAGDVE
jgi:hypothetical protein